MLWVIVAWVLGFVVPDLLGLTEMVMMSRFGIIKGHLYTLLYTNLIRFLAIIFLILLIKSIPASLFSIVRIDALAFTILVLAAILVSIILVPHQGIKILNEIRFYYNKTGNYWPLFITNRFLLHILQISTISIMLMILNKYFNPIFSGFIAGGLWALIDLILRNFRFGIYNLLLSIILSISYSQFGSLPLNIIIGIIPQII